jgi:LPXTG-site transpeptidase (sortase) family protein
MKRNEHTASAAALVTPQMRSCVFLFFFAFLLTFTVTFAILSAFGIVPESPEEDAPAAVESAEKKLDTNPMVESYAVPMRIVADAINLDVAVENPASRDIATLDAALLKGAVRYPSSGLLSDNNNMLVFGHSSGLPVIHNQNYKIFNNLKNLEAGDIVRVYSEKREYLYRVDTVSHVDAADALVTFNEGIKKLTLSTCDSFGKKTERYVVEASFVGSYPIEA